MAKIRIILKTRSGHIITSKTDSHNDEEIKEIKDLCSNIGNLTYFKLEGEDGDPIYVHGDDISTIKIVNVKE